MKEQPAMFLDVIKTVANGGQYLHPEMARRIAFPHVDQSPDVNRRYSLTRPAPIASTGRDAVSSFIAFASIPRPGRPRPPDRLACRGADSGAPPAPQGRPRGSASTR